jgi:SET domain-containing protein
MPKLIYPKGYKPQRYYRNPKVEVRKSPVHGVGVFAKKRIAKNEVLEECPFIILETEWNKLPKPLWEYIFAWTKDLPDEKSKAALVFGTGALYNSTKKPNADWETDKAKERFIFYAKQKIEKGEEIFIDYGSEYWETRDIKYKG